MLYWLGMDTGVYGFACKYIGGPTVAIKYMRA